MLPQQPEQVCFLPSARGVEEEFAMRLCGAGRVHPNSPTDLPGQLGPAARALSWEDSAEPGEDSSGLSSLPSGTLGLASQPSPPWPY